VDAAAGFTVANIAKLAAASVMLSKRFAVRPLIRAPSPPDPPSAFPISKGI
jgi:hypothetical protein